MGIEIYKVDIKCDNCNRFNTIKIKKGIEVEKFVEDLECEYCGCKTLEKD